MATTFNDNNCTNINIDKRQMSDAFLEMSNNIKTKRGATFSFG